MPKAFAERARRMARRILFILILFPITEGHAGRPTEHKATHCTAIDPSARAARSRTGGPAVCQAKPGWRNLADPGVRGAPTEAWDTTVDRFRTAGNAVLATGNWTVNDKTWTETFNDEMISVRQDQIQRGAETRQYLLQVQGNGSMVEQAGNLAGARNMIKQSSYIGRAGLEVAQFFAGAGVVRGIGMAGRGLASVGRAASAGQYGNTVGRFANATGNAARVTGNAIAQPFRAAGRTAANTRDQLAARSWSAGGNVPNNPSTLASNMGIGETQTISYLPTRNWNQIGDRAKGYIRQFEDSGNGIINIESKVTFSDMKQIHLATGREVSLVEAPNRQLQLVIGNTDNSIILPRNTQRVVAHTHPEGDDLLSIQDLQTMVNLEQNRTVLLPINQKGITYNNIIDDFDWYINQLVKHRGFPDPR